MGRVNVASILAAVFLVLSMVALNVKGAEMAIPYALCGIICAILAHLK